MRNGSLNMKIFPIFIILLLFALYSIYSKIKILELKERIIILEARQLSAEINLDTAWGKIEKTDNSLKTLEDRFYSFSSNMTIHANILNNIQAYLQFKKSQ